MEDAMANITQDQVLRLSNRIGMLEVTNTRKAGALSVVLNSPQSFTNNVPALVGYSSKVVENGIISGNTASGTFCASEDCTVLLIYQQEITHSSVEDQYHLELYGNGSLLGRIASCRIPAGMTATAAFAASVDLSAGTVYSLKICANGNSGTHTPQYQYSCNRLSVTVTGCTGSTGPQGRKGDKGDRGDQGLQGTQGVQGIQGAKGDKGDKGDRGDTGDAAPQTAVEYSPDGQSWHSVYAPGDDYIRFSTDGGDVWGESIYIRGRQGLQGTQGETGTVYRMRGVYEAGTGYVSNTEYIDCVTYNGSAYYAKQNTAGNLPGDTIYWGLLAQKGMDGSGTGDVIAPTGNTDNNFPQWNGNDTKTLKDGMSLSDIILAAKQAVYPVGSLYYNADNPANPVTLMGFGTWVAFGAGRVPVGLAGGDSDFGTIGATPGEKTHTLQQTEIPSHTHTMNPHSHTIDHDHAAFNSDPETSDHSHYISGNTLGSGGHGHSLQWNGERYISLSGNNVGGSYQSSGYRVSYTSGSVYDYSMIASPVASHTHGIGFQSQGRSASHTHSVNIPNFTGNSGSAQPAAGFTGGGAAHNNIQPSIVVYIWKRSA